MKTKEELLKRINEINFEIKNLQEEGLRIAGRLDLMAEMDEEKVKLKEAPKA
jgi:hypothetical protein